LAEAILARRSRTDLMDSVRPKMTDSGGITPKDWANGLMGLTVACIIFASAPAERSCTWNTKARQHRRLSPIKALKFGQ
jgi:hypothetical protein